MTTQLNYSFAFLVLAIDFDIRLRSRVTTLLSKLIFIAERSRKRKSHAKRCSNWQIFYELIDLFTFDLGGGRLSIKLSRFDIPWSERVNNHTSLVLRWQKIPRSVVCERGWSTFVCFSDLNHEKTHRFAFFYLVCLFFWKLSEYGLSSLLTVDLPDCCQTLPWTCFW